LFDTVHYATVCKGLNNNDNYNNLIYEVSYGQFRGTGAWQTVLAACNAKCII